MLLYTYFVTKGSDISFTFGEFNVFVFEDKMLYFIRQYICDADKYKQHPKSLCQEKMADLLFTTK